MRWFELQDFLFLIKCMKDPSDNFDVKSFISFANSSTRATSANKLNYNIYHSTTTRHFILIELVTFGTQSRVQTLEPLCR